MVVGSDLGVQETKMDIYSLVGCFLFHCFFEKETDALKMKVFVELKCTIDIKMYT